MEEIMHSTHLALIVTCSLAAAGPALAVDRWDSGGGITDSGPFTQNELRHGALQAAHDFDSTLDQDWAVVVTQARHSYEARVGSGNVAWRRVPPGPVDCTDCATLDRVNASGVVLTAGSADSGLDSQAVFGFSSSVRWIAAADAQDYIRTQAVQQFGPDYDLQFFDTSYLIPRFNNSGTQVTVLLVQNGSRFVVNAQVHFYNSAGTLLHSQPLTLPVQGNVVLNTATIPALQNVSGTAVVAHTAPYGMLSGKAVALEPATGFTFDTPLAPIPY
jgi:hypothetical protein